MLSHIISSIILDRVCPICKGSGVYRQDRQIVDCKNCNRKGYLYEADHSVLFVVSKDLVPWGVRESMKMQNILVVDALDQIYKEYSRLYTYNIPMEMLSSLAGKPKEIRMYFG